MRRKRVDIVCCKGGTSGDTGVHVVTGDSRSKAALVCRDQGWYRGRHVSCVDTGVDDDVPTHRSHRFTVVRRNLRELLLTLLWREIKQFCGAKQLFKMSLFNDRRWNHHSKRRDKTNSAISARNIQPFEVLQVWKLLNWMHKAFQVSGYRLTKFSSKLKNEIQRLVFVAFIKSFRAFLLCRTTALLQHSVNAASLILSEALAHGDFILCCKHYE